MDQKEYAVKKLEKMGGRKIWNELGKTFPYHDFILQKPKVSRTQASQIGPKDQYTTRYSK